MSRKKIAAANWKMNTTVDEGLELLSNLCTRHLDEGTEVVVCAPATHLYALSKSMPQRHVHLGGQNIYTQPSGAYTGEISGAMLKSAGADYVIVGHSERRGYFGELDDFLGQKVIAALDHSLTPIFCCGEGLDIRKEGNHVEHVISQLQEAFDVLTPEQVNQLVIAYEPIWAIGTGETASPQQAQEMHAAIRAYLSDQYGESIAQHIPILYGGSVKPANAKEIFGQADVDGGLVGGASLKPDSFAEIVNSF